MTGALLHRHFVETKLRVFNAVICLLPGGGGYCRNHLSILIGNHSLVWLGGVRCRTDISVEDHWNAYGLCMAGNEASDRYSGGLGGT